MSTQPEYQTIPDVYAAMERGEQQFTVTGAPLVPGKRQMWSYMRYIIPAFALVIGVSIVVTLVVRNFTATWIYLAFIGAALVYAAIRGRIVKPADAVYFNLLEHTHGSPEASRVVADYAFHTEPDGSVTVRRTWAAAHRTLSRVIVIAVIAAGVVGLMAIIVRTMPA